MSIPRLADAQYIPISQVIVKNRLRTEDAVYQKHVEELAHSLATIGPIHPITIDENNNLIAGRCRLAAHELLKETEIAFVRRTELTDGDRIMLEVEENLRRRRMKWHDTCMGICKAHKMHSSLAAAKKTEWGLRATGSLLKVSHEYVKTALIVGELIEKNDTEIMSAPSMDKARDLILARREKAAIEALAKKSAAGGMISMNSVKEKNAPPRPSGIINLQLGPVPISNAPIEKNTPTLSAYTSISISDRLHNVDCTDFMKNVMSPESVDLIVTDIPYGIDMDLMEGMHGVDEMRSTHDVEQNVDQMLPFLEGSYRVLKNNTYLFFFYALQHHEKLRDWGKQVGFEVQDWPLLWLKPHSCKNNAPHCNFTKSFEPCMVMRKGKPRLAKAMTKCHLEVDAMPEKKMQSNPFAKPLQFLSEMIFKPVSYPGMVVLDPFAGEGSVLRAAILAGCQIIGCEIDKERFPRLIERVKGVYTNMLNKNVHFT